MERADVQLFRSIIGTPIGDLLALASDEGLCALEFTTVEGPNRGQERLTRLNARLGRWFPPHDIVDRETPTIARTHTVQKGDTLYGLSKRYQVSLAELQAANPGLSERNFPIGRTLKIPVK